MSPHPYHILTDFDGVWTDPSDELHAVHETVVRELIRVTGEPEPTVRSELDRFEQSVLSQPVEHGWKIGGHITSYADEDFFGLPAAVGAVMEHGEGETAIRWREAIHKAGDPHVTAFMDRCFHTTCEAFRESRPHDLAEGAWDVLGELVEDGVRITFATNAPFEKVHQWLGHHGLEVFNARDAEHDEQPIRAYGRAGKQWLDPDGAAISIADRRVVTDRPQYRAIIEAERPDLVLGDVFSLDLSQAVGMRVEGHAVAPRHVAIFQREHTPRWVLDTLGTGPGGIDAAVTEVTDILPMVRHLRSSA